MTHIWQIAFYFVCFLLGMSLGRQYVTSRKRRMDESRSIVIRFPYPIEGNHVARQSELFRDIVREQLRPDACSLIVAGRWIPIWPPPPSRDSETNALRDQVNHKLIREGIESHNTIRKREEELRDARSSNPSSQGDL